MANGYYGGAPNAFAGGMVFSQDQRRRRVQENALNALIGRFGPEAADPQSLALLQGVEQSEQLFPHQLGEAQRATAGAEENVRQFGPAAGTVATQGVETREHDQRRNILHRAVSALKMVRDRKGDMPGALQQFGQILSRIGMPEDELMDLQQQIITNPDTLNELDTLLQPAGSASSRGLSGGIAMRNRETGQLEWVIPTENGFRVIPGRTPATAEQGYERIRQGDERLGLGWSNLDWDQVEAYLPARQAGVQLFPTEDGRVVADVVPGSPAEQELKNTLREMDAGDRKFLAAYGASSDHASVLQVNAERALEYMQSAEGGVILQVLRRGLRVVPGTNAHDAQQALEAVKNNIGIDELQRMRQSSPTGGAMGNVSDRDIALLTGVFGRLETENNPERVVEDLQNLMRTYERIVGFAREDAEAAQYRMELRARQGEQSFGPQPRPTSGGDAPAGGSTTRRTPPGPNATPEEILQYYSGGN